MLSYEDEILLEQYITYNHMSKSDRDMCMHLITNSKEVCDSELNDGEDRKYKVISMNFNSDGYIVLFNGILTNGNENRYVDGSITRKSDNYFVKTNIYRLNEFIEDDERDYCSLEVFRVLHDSVYRKTMYTSLAGYFEEELSPFDDIELYKNYCKIINRDEKCLKLD